MNARQRPEAASVLADAPAFALNASSGPRTLQDPFGHLVPLVLRREEASKGEAADLGQGIALHALGSRIAADHLPIGAQHVDRVVREGIEEKLQAPFIVQRLDPHPRFHHSPFRRRPRSVGSKTIWNAESAGWFHVRTDSPDKLSMGGDRFIAVLVPVPGARGTTRPNPREEFPRIGSSGQNTKKKLTRHDVGSI
jgi:hypothetical protein